MLIDMLMAALLAISLHLVGINAIDTPAEFFFIVFIIVCYGIVVYGRHKFEKEDDEET